MIVASPKSIREIVAVTAPHNKVLFVGCGTCVTVCLAGGEREVGIAAYAVRMARKLAGKPIVIEQATIERQCENEFIKDLVPLVERNEAVVSFGCGAGVQALAERFSGKPFYPRSTPNSSASSKNRPSGPKNASAAATACSPTSAASAPSPAAPNACSTVPAAAPAPNTAKSPPTVPAPGSSSTIVSRASASSTASIPSSRPRTGARPGTPALAELSAPSTASRQPRVPEFPFWVSRKSPPQLRLPLYFIIHILLYHTYCAGNRPQSYLPRREEQPPAGWGRTVQSPSVSALHTPSGAGARPRLPASQLGFHHFPGAAIMSQR